MYKIKQVLNTNVVIINQKGKEVVAFGKGIGYKRSKGALIKKDEILKMYVPLENAHVEDFLSFINNTPLEYLEISNEIINNTEKLLNISLNGKILYALTDHIYFTVQRLKSGISFKTSVYWEFKRFYPEEFRAGQQALKIIEEKIDIELPEQEAANIAFHIVNGNENSNLNVNAIQMTRLITNVTKSVRLSLSRPVNENSLHYERFLTHVKFFAERYLTNTMLDNDPMLLETVEMRYPQGIKISRKIQTTIEEIYGKKITDEEVAYLTIHINRIIMDSIQEEEK